MGIELEWGFRGKEKGRYNFGYSGQGILTIHKNSVNDLDAVKVDIRSVTAVKS